MYTYRTVEIFVRGELDAAWLFTRVSKIEDAVGWMVG
jgi:hypothetical protein